MTYALYPHGEHPYWCELLEPNCGTDREPRHRGRTSTLFAQTDEARIQIQLVRGDLQVPAGTRAGTVSVTLTLDEGAGQTSVSMARDEAKSLAILLSQYVDMVDRETRSATLSAPVEVLTTEMYAGARR